MNETYITSAIEIIAKEVLDIPTLDTRGSDELDFHDIGIVGPGPHPGDEAWLELGAFLTDANVAARVDPIPKRDVVGQCRQLAPVARLGLVNPTAHLIEVAHLVEPIEDRLVLCLADAVQTGVVAAAFHISGGEFLWQDPLKERDVLFHQLFL